MGTQVYFLRPVGARGPVKIGVSVEPQCRLQTLMSWSPVRLEIAAQISGDSQLERRFHNKFRAQWSHFEWFHGSDEMERTIAEIAAGVFDVETLPEARGVRDQNRNRWSVHSRYGASLSHRLRHLEGRGVTVPREISAAAWRYSGGWVQGEGRNGGQPGDALPVAKFLAANGYDFRAPPPAPVSMAEAA